MLSEVKGLVIRTVDYKETDRLVTIFTEERGVVSAMARGARSLKSRKLSSTMQFCYGNFILYTQGDKCYIKEAELIESFFDIRNTIEGLALATYICEVLSFVTVEESEVELLRLALNSLYAISTGKYSVDKIKAVFEIRCAAILGFMPDAIACHKCEEKHGDFFFDIMGGTLECYRCHDTAQRRREERESPHEASIVCILSEGAKDALCYSIYAPINKLYSFNIGEDDMRLFSRACEEYLLNQVDHEFKSLAFYKEVTRGVGGIKK
jgi:DNA repair protein RecO (recombination protein O)